MGGVSQIIERIVFWSCAPIFILIAIMCFVHLFVFGIEAAPNPAISAIDRVDSGPVFAVATPANASHAAGSALGGLFTIPLAKYPGASGVVTNVLWKSTGASTGVVLLRFWARNPVNTTCTDNTAFAGSDIDDAYLIAIPQSITPAAPAVTTGDTATYGALTGLTWDFKNFDTPTTTVNLYVCAITVSTDTADENKQVRLTVSGQQAIQ